MTDQQLNAAPDEDDLKDPQAIASAQNDANNQVNEFQSAGSSENELEALMSSATGNAAA